MFNKIKVYKLNGIIDDDEIVEIHNGNKTIFTCCWCYVPAKIRRGYCSRIWIKGECKHLCFMCKYKNECYDNLEL